MSILRKTVTIANDIKTNPSWTVNFPQVPFTPDEMIVKSVQTIANAATDVSFSVWSNITNEIIFSQCVHANSGSSQAYDLHFALKKPVQGSYTFTLYNLAGATFAAGAGPDAGLYFQLEFVKYDQ